MSTHRKYWRPLALALALGGLAVIVQLGSGQSAAGNAIDKMVRVTVPSGVALSIVSTDLSETQISTVGGAMVIDLRCNLILRNEGAKPIRGVTFAVLAQRMTAGGKASVAIPSLNVGKSESFPVRIDLRLLRPLPAPPSPVVEVSLDGVLLADLSFAGPDKFDSRRKMTVLELEARRDREFFLKALRAGGEDALREAIVGSVARQRQRPTLEARLAGNSGRAMGAAARAAQQGNVALAFAEIPDSPLELVGGWGAATGDMADSPRITVRNRSSRSIRYFELGWLIDSSSGTRYAAGAVPAPSGLRGLVPGGEAVTNRERSFRFVPLSPAGAGFSIDGMAGFVSQVQFADGSIWIPSREDLEQASLLGTLPVSAEEQRLTNLYQSKGLKNLVAELSSY